MARTVQRHWPQSLRALENPLEPLLHPYWQLQLNGEAHSWIIDGKSPLVWRRDGQAFACYGYPVADDVRCYCLSARGLRVNLGLPMLAEGLWLSGTPEGF